MNTEISVFVICVEAIIYLLLYNLHACTFKSIILLFSVLVFEIIGSVNPLSSLKRLISSSRLLNKNPSFSCTILFFRAKKNCSSISFSSNSTVSSAVAQIFQCKFNIARVMVVYINCKKVINFISYLHVKSCCSFMKLCCWIL